jgi:hypothetical protein
MVAQAKSAVTEPRVSERKRSSGDLSRLGEEVKALLGDSWMPTLYSGQILPNRTRSYHLDLPGRAVSIDIQHTLLGVELKIGKKRRLCPDLATARYLAVFARAGCPDVAVPYDITQISGYADTLESSWHRMLLLIEHLTADRPASIRTRLRAEIVSELRHEIRRAGAGTPIPQFKQSTRQRPPR